MRLLKVPELCVKDVLGDLPTPTPRPDVYVDEHDDASYRKLHPARSSNTLISGHRAPPAHYDQPRSITVREAARLQGFPDTFRVYGPFANQMGQVTNAVPPPLARVALEVLCDVAGVDF